MKAKVRDLLIEKRKKLTKKEILEKSNRIKKRLFSLEQFISADTVLFYVSYDNEVHTHQMIKECLDGSKKVIVPKSITKNCSLVLSELRNWDDLEVGAYNILEPKKEAIKKVNLKDIDLILVPGVGFDEKGQRIGHGKGYYDRFLKKVRNIPIVALSFECQIVDNVPTDDYDILMDIIITENRIILCNKP